jgi:diadenosine tetraphosphatase ApaH/serine/threonine PP2A family protein phosphatase
MSYKSAFAKGDMVRIASLSDLEQFRNTWRFHHKLESEQLTYADLTAHVRDVGFYHGGDVLYWLEGIPGTWHECCLRPSDT